MKRKIRSSGLVVIPKAGHTINLEDPELFNRALPRLPHRGGRGALAAAQPAIADRLGHHAGPTQ